MGRTTAVFVLVAACTACGDVEPEYLEIPDLGDAKAILVAVEHPSGETEIAAYDSPPIFVGALTEGAKVTLIGINSSLMDLGLSEGSIFPSSEPAVTIGDVQTATFVSEVSGDSVAPFEPSMLSSELARFPLQPYDFCPRIEIEQEREFPSSRELLSLRTRSMGPMLRDRKSIIRFTADWTPQIWTSSTGATLVGMVESEEDRVFVLTTDGLYEVAQGPELRVELVERVDTTVPDGELQELYILGPGHFLSISSTGVLYEHDGGGWSEVFRVPSEILRYDITRPTFFKAGRDLYVIADEMGGLIKIPETGSPQVVQVGALSKGFVVTGRNEDETPFVIDTFDGQFFNYSAAEGGQWTRGFSSKTPDVWGMQPWREGYVLVSAKGVLRAVAPKANLLCDEVSIGSYNEIHTVIDINGRLLVGALVWRTGQDFSWSWVTAPPR